MIHKEKSYKVLAILLTAVCLSLALSCISDCDPFIEGEGVRVNVNGVKYSMLLAPWSDGLFKLNDSGQGGFKTTFSLTSALHMNSYKGGVKMIMMQLGVNSPVEAGQEYLLREGEAGYAKILDLGTLSVLTDYEKAAAKADTLTSVSGKISILSLDNGNGEAEALFELEGTGGYGKKYEFRHGFIRLKTEM